MLQESGRRLDYGARFLKADNGKARKVRRPDRENYGTAAWKRLRWEVLVRDDFTCQRCWGTPHPDLTRQCRALKAIDMPHLIKGKAPNLVADHIDPHRGDEVLFWDRQNLQCLCAGCHNRDKQRIERASQGWGG